MPTQTPTAVHWKLVVDAADPHTRAGFWAAALRYQAEDNSALVEHLLSRGVLPGQATVEYHGRPAFRDLIAVRHPDDPYDQDTGTGLGRRLLFQRVGRPRAARTGFTSTGTPATGGARRRWRASGPSGHGCCGR